MEVTHKMIDSMAKVMSAEDRKGYLPELRKEIAQKHRLGRAALRLSKEQYENETKVGALMILSGGLDLQKALLFHQLIDEATVILQRDWHHSEVIPRDYAFEFRNQMRVLRPYTAEDMDKYAENTAELVETVGSPDTVSFWLWAVYHGDFREMIAREAEGLGFVKKVKGV